MGAESAAKYAAHKRANYDDDGHGDARLRQVTKKVAEKATKETKKTLRRTLRCILFCPLRLSCCFCTSIGGVLRLMRSDTTREFALAVVVPSSSSKPRLPLPCAEWRTICADCAVPVGR